MENLHFDRLLSLKLRRSHWIVLFLSVGVAQSCVRKSFTDTNFQIAPVSYCFQITVQSLHLNNPHSRWRQWVRSHPLTDTSSHRDTLCSFTCVLIPVWGNHHYKSDLVLIKLEQNFGGFGSVVTLCVIAVCCQVLTLRCLFTCTVVNTQTKGRGFALCVAWSPSTFYFMGCQNYQQGKWQTSDLSVRELCKKLIGIDHQLFWFMSFTNMPSFISSCSQANTGWTHHLHGGAIKVTTYCRCKVTYNNLWTSSAKYSVRL